MKKFANLLHCDSALAGSHVHCLAYAQMFAMESDIMKKTAATILAMLLVSACSWDGEFYDAVVYKDNVNYCPPFDQDGVEQEGKFIYIKKFDNVCYRFMDNYDFPKDVLVCKNDDDCCGLDKKTARQYILAFNNFMCPAHYQCEHSDDESTSNYYCNYFKDCPVGFHVSPVSDECEEDSETACGSYNNNCLVRKGFAEAKCVLGHCSAESCDGMYHLVKDNSIKDADVFDCVNNSIDECPILDKKGNIAYEQSGETRLENCAESFETGQTSAVCTAQGCKVESCDNGYHLNQDETQCEQDSFEHCGAWYNDCRNNGKSVGKCVKKDDEYLCVAEVCENGYTLISGECQPNNNMHCGTKDDGSVRTCGADEVCDSIKAECVRKSSGCPSNLLFCDNICVSPSSTFHCGTCDNNCGEGVCENGNCSCQSGTADCDHIRGCETNLNKLHLSSCSTCEKDYYDLNGDKRDGCEFQLSEYGLELDPSGNLTCGSYIGYTSTGNPVSLKYKMCGDYKLTLNNKNYTIPLCLKYYFDDKKMFNGFDSCKFLCNSNTTLYVSSIPYKGRICEPTQSCYQGGTFTQCYGDYCFEYNKVLCHK